VNALTFKVTTVRLPEETLEALEDLTDKLQRERSDIMREAMQIGIGEMKLRLALELYTKGKVSFGRMAELTGLGYRELSLALKRRNVTLRYGEKRFSEEIEQPVG
jgi:predicted HTH domain antitoxin